MAHYVKLFESIIHSTLWQEDAHIKVVWVTLLALADYNGEVQASIPGLAKISGVSIEQCEEALAKFMAPDKYSRSQTCEGRRLEVIDGGWELINYTKYKHLKSAEQEKESAALRKRKQREREKAVTDVTKSHTESPHIDVSVSVPPSLGLKEEECPAAPPVAEQTPLTLMGEPKRKSRQSKKGPKLTDLKPDSVKAFEAAWETPPPTAMQRIQTFAGKWVDQEVPVQRGSRAQAERNFQSIVDAGHATPRELYAAFFVYTQGPRNGFFQHLSTFYGPEKATWREYLTQAREAIAAQDAEKG